MCSNYYFYLLYFTLFQFLPAILIDIVSVLAGKKTWAIKLQRRIFNSLKVFEYFINNSWQFESKNNQLLYQMINVEERWVTFIVIRNYLLFNIILFCREKFYFDVSTLDINQYIDNWLIGSRRFIMKLDDSSIPEAKRKYQFLFWLDFIVKALCFFGIAYALFKGYTGIFSTQTTIVDVY